MHGNLAPRDERYLERHKKFVPLSFIINFIATESLTRGVEIEADKNKIKKWIDIHLPVKHLNDFTTSPLEKFFESFSSPTIKIISEALQQIKLCLTPRKKLSSDKSRIIVVDAHERINIILDYMRLLAVRTHKNDDDDLFDPAIHIKSERMTEYDNLQEKLRMAGERVKKNFKPFAVNISNTLIRDLRIGDENKAVLIGRLRVQCDRIMIALQEVFDKMNRDDLSKLIDALYEFRESISPAYAIAREPATLTLEYLKALEAQVNMHLWINHRFKK